MLITGDNFCCISSLLNMCLFYFSSDCVDNLDFAEWAARGLTGTTYAYLFKPGVYNLFFIDHFGASAPYKSIYHHFGLTPEKVVEAVQQRR